MITEGMHDIPAGHVPAVVTYLKMHAPAMAGVSSFPDGVTATRDIPDPDSYRELFRAVGTPWLWTSRLLLDDADLKAVLADDGTELWVIRKNDDPIGIVELNFFPSGDCELAFFGMVQQATGQGLGGPMMALAQSRAFARDINRLYLHTCNWDDPRAVAFYKRAGFQPYKMAVEVFPDPRLRGVHTPETAPQVPYLP